MSAALEKVRNIGIIAHIDAGKTTTTEAILYYAGVTHRIGEVDEGTTVTDFDPEEAQRGITIYSVAITCSWLGHTINLIDTPGHVDFTAEVERSLRVLDGGVVVFSAVEGVEAQSETVWRQADKYKVPRLCFINKLDRIGADFNRVVDQIRQRLHGNPLILMIPIGLGPETNTNGFSGLIDLVHMQALYFDKESQGAKIEVKPIPESELERAQLARAELLDAITLLDDRAAEIFLETEDLPADEIRRVVRQATVQAKIQPLLCGSSLHHVGVQPLLDAVVHYLPNPLDMPPVHGTNPSPKKAGQPEVRRPSDKDPLCALVFKIVADKHNEFYFARVYSGVLKERSRLLNPRTGSKEMITQLWQVQADRREQISEAPAGAIVGVIGPKDSVTGDTLCDPNQPILLEAIRFPETVISMAIEPESSADRKKLEETLRLMAKQDPTFTAKISEETGQTIISGMGELHLEIIANRMQRDFGMKMRVHKPRVTYRETVKRAVEAEGVFERQQAGVAQFAAVKVRMEPYATEQTVIVDNKLKPGTLSEEHTALLMRTLQDEARGSGLIGFPLINVKVTLLGVRTRDGETTDVALAAAAALAIRQALPEAGVSLLEPIMKLEIVTPNDFVGNITADLNSRRASILNTELRGNLIALEAEAPLSQMFGYSTQSRSLSQGRASYSMEPLRYAEAPKSVVDEIMGN